MNYTQNERIEQVSNETLVIGIDIGSQTHYARAFDNRGKELTKRVFSFKNDIDGFNSFDQWAEKIRTENGKEKIMIGCEPTGHYWFIVPGTRGLGKRAGILGSSSAEMKAT